MDARVYFERLKRTMAIAGYYSFSIINSVFPFVHVDQDIKGEDGWPAVWTAVERAGIRPQRARRDVYYCEFDTQKMPVGLFVGHYIWNEEKWDYVRYVRDGKTGELRAVHV